MEQENTLFRKEALDRISSPEQLNDYLKVSDALDSLKCTRIVIAHRLSTIKNCNRIIVLDGGRIVEDGTFDELVAAEGFFADLVKRQHPDA